MLHEFLPFYSISMYLYDKNISEYAEIAVTDCNSKILNIEGHSTTYLLRSISASSFSETNRNNVKFV